MQRTWWAEAGTFIVTGPFCMSIKDRCDTVRGEYWIPCSHLYRYSYCRTVQHKHLLISTLVLYMPIFILLRAQTYALHAWMIFGCSAKLLFISMLMFSRAPYLYMLLSQVSMFVRNDEAHFAIKSMIPWNNSNRKRQPWCSHSGWLPAFKVSKRNLAENL